MSIFRIVTIVAAALMLAIVAPLPGRADEISRQQETLRAPLRAAYVKAKQAESDAIDRRQKAIDRMTALLQAGNRELDQIQSDLKTAQGKLDDRRQEQKLAAKALDAALGSHGRDAADPVVVTAQTRLDAVDAEVKELERQVAQLQQSQRDKVSIPNADPIYQELILASAELDQRRQETLKAMAAYMAVIKPQPPPYLQSVQVYVGAAAKYRAEWRIDDQAADTATHELTGRLEKILADLRDALDQMQAERDDLKERRDVLLPSMQLYSATIVHAADDAAFASYGLILGPAIIEAVGVVLEAVLTGGASTAQRYAVEQATQSGTQVIGALVKNQTGKVLSAAEQATVNRVGHIAEGLDSTAGGLLVTFDAKLGSDQGMSAKGNDLIDRIGLRPGASDAAKVLAGDAAEQAIQRVGKAAIVNLDYKIAAAVAANADQTLGAWQVVRNGSGAFFAAKPPLKSIKEAALGAKNANVLGLCISAAKAVTAAYFGAQLGIAQELYAESMVNLSITYDGYYLLLKADRLLFDKQREMQNLYFETFAYRLKSAGPRKLVVMQNDGVDGSQDTVTIALHFSEPLDHPPQVRILGLQLDMQPQDKAADGRSAIWEGKIAPKKLPDNVKEALLEVRLGLGSRPYLELDSDPTTPARFNLPDDLTKDLPDREEWSDYERGADKNHRIAFAAPGLQLPVPWHGHSTCDQINCDCGAVPVSAGIGGDTARRQCLSSEKSLREDCAKRGQTMGVCVGGGPNAYPPPTNVQLAPVPQPPPKPLPPQNVVPTIPDRPR